ncbi:LacI family DNA-binding transcriptional regulator [Streptomyces sp. NPDC052052]|uniref:LacI family DNA-binding transcriptional regulator n=1 Tax=Streptomyces sp. NPDC052052 TaxID=3154756 RepID=UPI00344680DE
MSISPQSGRPARGRRVTSADVAGLAGVSRTTVSDVLNGQRIARYHPATVQRVRGAAAELGYVRSAAGRALAMGRSDFIVVVVPYVTYMRFQDVIEALSGHIEEFGFSAVVHFRGPKEEDGGTSRLLTLVETLRPAGVVDLGGLTPKEAAFIEKTCCSVLPQDKPADPNVWIGLLQAEHLHSRGFRQLAYAFLSDARDDPYGQTRAASVADYCEAEGLPVPLRLHVPIEPEGAREAVRSLLERTDGGRLGIACHNDEVAIAVVFAAQRLGLELPRDAGVIGVEGGDLGQAMAPRLTTVLGDAAAAVHHVRFSLGRTYGGPVPTGETPPLDQVFRVLPGETT